MNKVAMPLGTRVRESSYLLQVGRGFLMGGADIIPGVSGGTVALILGIYERLVTAISRFDMKLLAHVKSGEWAAAARHVDLAFLASLGCGIGLGIGGLASLMHYLLEHQIQHTYAAFFGLILASSLIVGKMVEKWSMTTAVGLIAGGAFAYWLVGLVPATPPQGNGYVFLCGMIAICAMILPGISGAFILLIMGKYADIVGLLKGMLHGEITGGGLLTLGTFAVGAALGLLGFSKFLHWLLARFHAATLAVLCGFMVGSLRKIWPFKHELSLADTPFQSKQFENVWPDVTDGSVWMSVMITVAGVAFVLTLDRLTSTAESPASPALSEPAE